MTNTTAPAPTCPFWIQALPRVIGLWLLAGAVFKLGWGTPAHLPAIVRDISPLGLQHTYQTVIAIEFVLIVLAFLRPRWAWFLLAGCLGTFCAILISQIAAGETNCGCFGANFSPDPRVMLGIDATLLVLLLVSKPWNNLPTRGANVIAIVILSLGLAALPFVYSREVKLPAALPRTAQVASEATDANPENTGEPATETSAETPPIVAVTPPAGAYLILDPDELKGKHIDDTPFASYIDVYSLPYDGLWVIYRHTCEHCEEHLIDMAQTEMGTRMIGLVRLIEKDDSDQNRVVHVLPQGPHVMMADMPEMDYVITTPAELLIENGIIIDAKEGVEPGHGL